MKIHVFLVLLIALVLGLGCGDGDPDTNEGDGGDDNPDGGDDSDPDENIDPECDGDPEEMSLSASLVSSMGDLDFPDAEISLIHRIGDVADGGGCISRIGVTLSYGGGCALEFIAKDEYDDEGALTLISVEQTVNASCPDFSADIEGVYQYSNNVGDMSVAKLTPSTTHVFDNTAAHECVDIEMVIELEGSLDKFGGGDPLTFDPATVTIRGEFNSEGYDSSVCPENMP